MPDRFQPPHPAVALGYHTKNRPNDLLGRIEHSMTIIAGILAEDGPQYLPLFERLEKERAELQEREASYRRALDLAKPK